MNEQQTVNDANKAIVTDSKGRTINIKKLTAFERMKLFQAVGAELSDNSAYMAYALCAASVTAIDAVPEALPHNQRAIETMVKVLGDEGIEAVSKGYKEHFSVGETGDLETIKN